MERLLYIDQYPVDSMLSKIASEAIKIDIGRNYLEAVSYIEEQDNKPNFIVCSLDGYHAQCFDFLRKLKAMNRFLPIICVAHKFTNNDIITGYSLGVLDFMTKPVDPSILLAKMYSQMMLIGRSADENKNTKNYEKFSVTTVQNQITEAIEIISKNDLTQSEELQNIKQRLSKIKAIPNNSVNSESESINLKDTISIVASYSGLSCVEINQSLKAPILIMDYKYFCAALEHMFEYIKSIVLAKGVLKISYIINNGNFEMLIELHDFGSVIAPQRLEFTKKVINLHGGGMEIDERFGRGSKIIITLPSYRVLT